ncbi:redoxin domain-containing protein [Singulisphaera rosea]
MSPFLTSVQLIGLLIELVSRVMIHCRGIVVKNPILCCEAFMVGRTSVIVLVCMLFFWEVRGDDSTNASNNQRVVEGRISTVGSLPIEGARLFFTPELLGRSFIEGAEAKTDAQGRYRIDLRRFPWSMKPFRAVVLAPGYKVGDRILETVVGRTTTDFELNAQPWRETIFCVETSTNEPLANVVLACSIGGVRWTRAKTDADGRCRLAIPPSLGMTVAANPVGARPVELNLSGTENEPTTLRLPALPPIRGRVVDVEGRPVPDVAVGLWISFDSERGASVRPFSDGSRTVTNGNGDFLICPVVSIHSYDLTSRLVEGVDLCFADLSYNRLACKFFESSQLMKPIEIKLERGRRVRIPVAPESVGLSSGNQVETIISVALHADRPREWSTLSMRYSILKDFAGHGEALLPEECLPEGRYQLKTFIWRATGDGAAGFAQCEFVVPKGDGPLDVPPLIFERLPYQKMTGKPAPEIESTDLRTGRPVRLADFRGKVVLLDFWGFWCGPCIRDMPKLMDLHRRFEGRPLVIIGLHDGSIQSEAEYDQKITFARDRFWGGRDLPFHVLLDRRHPKKEGEHGTIGTGVTVERYSILEFPTLLIIDRDGTVVGKSRDNNDLEPLVRSLVEKAERF